MVIQLPKWVQTESELTIDQSLGRVVDGVPNCLKAAREEIKAGADFLKVGTCAFTVKNITNSWTFVIDHGRWRSRCVVYPRK